MSSSLFLSPPPTLTRCGSNFNGIHRRSGKIRHINYRGVKVLVSRSSYYTFNSSDDSLDTEDWKKNGHDIATLGNLCVDIVHHNVPSRQLPPENIEARKYFMNQLSSCPSDQQYWEAGGQCNTAIAASRLGLKCIALGYVGDDKYGDFLLDVLHDEGIDFIKMGNERPVTTKAKSAFDTLRCWVMVDPSTRHVFCGPADFTKEPAFGWIRELKWEVQSAIKKAKILVVNGFGFDDLSPELMLAALNHAVEVGTCIFFDPGPRGKSLSTETPEKQVALNAFLKMSDLILLTSDEAHSLTGIQNPIFAGQELLKQGLRTKSVIIKIGSKGSILITSDGASCASSFKVKVIDTVGCGDSFVAAVAFGFIHKMPMIHTLTIANAVGASTAMGHGGGRNVATFAKALELVKSGDLQECNEFWRKLIDQYAEPQKVTLLSKKSATEIDTQVNCVPLEKVILELTSKLESAKLGGAEST